MQKYQESIKQYDNDHSVNYTNIESNFSQFIKDFYNSKKYTNEIPKNPNYDSFSYLLLIYTIWMKKFSQKVRIEIIDKTHFKIKIHKNVGKDNLLNFKVLFQELTLDRISIYESDISDEWICDLFY